ncbi:unnamed protein product [Symbiodinium natans]|uniref:Uncharacterized protein n=1 Tax=Symbiodinium natans TaxID=878477 RepID=A0A812KX95_9DINO|nr:unnamed protein product [Symbiodinium natans]
MLVGPSVVEELELLRTEMEAARRGAAEAREALRQSAEVGQMLLSRNEALEQELDVLRMEKSRIAASEVRQRQGLEEECRRLELELERDGRKARQLRLQSAASVDSDEELSMEQMRQRLKRSEQSEQEHREAACLAEEHAVALEERHRRLEEEHRKLQAECQKSRRRTSSPREKEEGEEKDKDAEDLARQRWRRAGRAVVQRLSASSSYETPKPPSPSSLASLASLASPSRRSERSENRSENREDLEQQMAGVAAERDALRAEKASSESRAQELEEDNTTLRLLLEEEAQRTEALAQQVDYLADLLEERQAQSGARDMMRSLWGSRDPSPENPNQPPAPSLCEEAKFQVRPRDASRGPAEAQSLESFLADLRSRSPSVSRKRSRPPHVTLEDFLGEKPACLFNVTASTRAAAKLPGQPEKASLLELLGWRRCQTCGSLTWAPLTAQREEDRGKQPPHPKMKLSTVSASKKSAKGWTFALVSSQDESCGAAPARGRTPAVRTES